MNLFLIGLIYFSLASIPVGIAAWRLGRLLEEPRLRRCAVPFFNIMLLGHLLDMDPGVTLIVALLFWLPYSAIVILPILAGRFANHTGRPRWLGWVLSIFPFSMLGLIVLSATARRTVATR